MHLCCFYIWHQACQERHIGRKKPVMSCPFTSSVVSIFVLKAEESWIAAELVKELLVLTVRSSVMVIGFFFNWLWAWMTWCAPLCVWSDNHSCWFVSLDLSTSGGLLCWLGSGWAASISDGMILMRLPEVSLTNSALLRNFRTVFWHVFSLDSCSPLICKWFWQLYC